MLADSSGVAVWPAHATLLVSDLHLEKGTASAGRGVFLPPYDTRETLNRLADAIARYEPRRVVALGDSFHSAHAADGLDADRLAQVAALQSGREWVWITGNHDPAVPKRLGGDVCNELMLDGLALRHRPAASTDSGASEIAGHLHPAARLAKNGSAVRRRCFISDPRRMIMPAFGALAGGLNVLDEAFSLLFGAGLRSSKVAVRMLGNGNVFSVSPRLLVGD